MNPITVVKWFLIWGAVSLIFFIFSLQYCLRDDGGFKTFHNPKYVYGEGNKKFFYDRSMPLIFVGGVPRSGTTLMRVMLDAHPDIRCGPETRIISRILQFRKLISQSPYETERLEAAGVKQNVLDSVIASSFLEVIVRHGEPANRFCCKEPFTLNHIGYLSTLFPNSKFIFMVRDGRATVHSIISRKIVIRGLNSSSYEQCMREWNDIISTMHTECIHVGPSKCMIVYYEKLVLQPRVWLKEILNFLNVPWSDSVLHHEKHVSKPGGAILSMYEKSSDQVRKPLDVGALTRWAEYFPDGVKKDVPSIAPMLSKLGYDSLAYPPNYASLGSPGKPEKTDSPRVQTKRI